MELIVMVLSCFSRSHTHTHASHAAVFSKPVTHTHSCATNSTHNYAHWGTHSAVQAQSMLHRPAHSHRERRGGSHHKSSRGQANVNHAPSGTEEDEGAAPPVGVVHPHPIYVHPAMPQVCACPCVPLLVCVCPCLSSTCPCGFFFH